MSTIETKPCPACDGKGFTSELGAYGQPERERCDGCNGVGLIELNGSWITVTLAKRMPLAAMASADVADARLLAAAPEMLEALRGIEAWVAEVPRPYREFPFVVAARAAIARATGEG